MNEKFRNILNALQEGDREKIAKAIFMASPKTEYIIPGTPQFVIAEVVDMENEIPKRIKIELFYSGWKLLVMVSDEEDNVTFGYWVYQAQIEGVYIHE